MLVVQEEGLDGLLDGQAHQRRGAVTESVKAGLVEVVAGQVGSGG